MKRSATITVFLLFLYGCQSGMAGDERVWVAREFQGGKQCVEDYEPPDVRELLEKRGVSVAETAVEPMPVCLACEVCKAYAGRHYALIDGAGVEVAREAGFELSDPPPEESEEGVQLK